MNPGPLFIISYNFPTLLSPFIFYALFKSLNTKNTFTISKHTQNPKNTFILLFLISLSSHRLFCFIYYKFISVILIQNLMIDNHTVELGTQGKDFVS
jgi:hypothetical protein